MQFPMECLVALEVVYLDLYLDQQLVLVFGDYELLLLDLVLQSVLYHS